MRVCREKKRVYVYIYTESVCVSVKRINDRECVER